MNPFKAYQTTLTRFGPPRDRDAIELAHVTTALLNADSEDARSSAIELARRLWTRCGVNACHDSTGMSEPLKNTVVTLAGNMLRACDTAEAGDHRAVSTLIDVNRQVMSGLQAAPMRQPAPFAFQPRVRQVA